MSSNDITTPLHRPHAGNMKIKAGVACIAALCIVAWGIYSRDKDDNALAAVVQQHAYPVVHAIQPITSQDAQALILPGTLQAYNSASVYARVNGYLKQWQVDIGSNVKAGQLLAEIETPELDQQLKQSEANLQTALANEHLTEITSKRWQHLLKSDSVSQQEADEKGGDYQAKQALVIAAQADVNRLLALESFKHITAPFAGVVTARNTDIGALINAGHDAGHELFTVADISKMRLYVNVPQNYTQQINSGMAAQLEVPGLSGQTFKAVLTANSHAVNENSGTMLIEFEVNNTNGKLMAGGYGNVHLTLPSDQNVVKIPASALVFRKEGLSVATLTADNHVAFRPIHISRDLGNQVDIASGLAATDRLIDNPPDNLENGDMVELAGAKK